MSQARDLIDSQFEQYQSVDYSPEDLARYQELLAQQQVMLRGNQVMRQDRSGFTPEWTANWTEFENLRNHYNGMPPRQLSNERHPHLGSELARTH